MAWSMAVSSCSMFTFDFSGFELYILDQNINKSAQFFIYVYISNIHKSILLLKYTQFALFICHFFYYIADILGFFLKTIDDPP